MSRRPIDDSILFQQSEVQLKDTLDLCKDEKTLRCYLCHEGLLSDFLGICTKCKTDTLNYVTDRKDLVHV